MVATKTCFKCNETQPVEEFYRHRAMASKRLNKCRTCTKRENAEWRSIPANRARWNAQTHFRKIEKQFGLSREEYDNLYRDAKCAGCGATEGQFKRRLVVDHDHKTGKIRGLLCHECNRTIATADDNPTVLRRLAEYLENTCF